MRPLRFALFGAGFWSRFQLAAWREIEGAECVAVYNRTRSKAEDLAHAAGIGKAYHDAGALLRNEQLDFVDIVTNPETHFDLTKLAACQRLPVVCQKPMAPTLDEAAGMAGFCRQAGTSLYIHENWRWQTPIRQLKAILDTGQIGPPFRARIRMVSGFPVFDNQPFLRDLEQFLLMDIGSHILDVARFLFGEAASLYCQTQRVRADILGEDVATVVLRTVTGATVICELGYAGTPIEGDSFPQTLGYIEGPDGSIELRSDYWIHVTTRIETVKRRYPPCHYEWADPDYAIVHGSIVPCQADLLAGLRGERTPETTAEDNLKTMRLVFGAYESARRNEVILL